LPQLGREHPVPVVRALAQIEAQQRALSVNDEDIQAGIA